MASILVIDDDGLAAELYTSLLRGLRVSRPPLSRLARKSDPASWRVGAPRSGHARHHDAGYERRGPVALKLKADPQNQRAPRVVIFSRAG